MLVKNQSGVRTTLIVSLLGAGIVFGAHAESAAVTKTNMATRQDVATALCEIAVSTPEALQREAKAKGISKRKLKQLECNDLPALVLAKQQQEAAVFDARNLVNIE